jgi:hypothetical protein
MNHRTLIAIACGLLAAVTNARSHVVLDQPAAAAGSGYRAVFRVTHGCDGLPTVGITVMLPAGVQGAKPMPKPGWVLSLRKEPLATPYTSHGKRIDSDVRRFLGPPAATRRRSPVRTSTNSSCAPRYRARRARCGSRSPRSVVRPAGKCAANGLRCRRRAVTRKGCSPRRCGSRSSRQPRGMPSTEPAADAAGTGDGRALSTGAS